MNDGGRALFKKRSVLYRKTTFRETPKTTNQNETQTLGAKIKSQKGNSPDYILRF